MWQGLGKTFLGLLTLLVSFCWHLGKGTSVEVPPLNWPMRISLGNYLDCWCNRPQHIVPSLRRWLCAAYPGWGGKPASSVVPRFLCQPATLSLPWRPSMMDYNSVGWNKPPLPKFLLVMAFIRATEKQTGTSADTLRLAEGMTPRYRFLTSS